MTHRSSGTFEVKRHGEPPYDSVDGVMLARTRFDKVFHGDLQAVSTVEMLSAGGGAPNSAGYVAIERVKGTLQGHAGTFVLQHSGTMNRGTPTLSVTVVPDSGTGALKGIAGQMTIDIKEGQHFYSFDFTLET